MGARSGLYGGYSKCTCTDGVVTHWRSWDKLQYSVAHIVGSKLPNATKFHCTFLHLWSYLLHNLHEWNTFSVPKNRGYDFIEPIVCVYLFCFVLENLYVVTVKTAACFHNITRSFRYKWEHASNFMLKKP